MRGLLTAAAGMAVLGAVVTATTSYAAQATLSCPRVVRAGQQIIVDFTIPPRDGTESVPLQTPAGSPG